MQLNDEAARLREQGLEHLTVSILLLAEAGVKRKRAELMEAAELRAEASARRREGLALLDAAAMKRRARATRQEASQL